MTGDKANNQNVAVFIASPGDLEPERRQFLESIDRLNGGFGEGAGVTFEPLGAEALLSTGGLRTKSVINQQQIDRCDVFILVLNRRWGQDAPDSDYSSYTEEEFHRALARFESSGTPAIFIFFKHVDPESIGDPGPQLKKVIEFRQSLEMTRKVLYRDFDDINSFADGVDRHLRAYVRGELPDVKETSVVALETQVASSSKDVSQAPQSNRTLILSSASVLAALAEYREKIRGNNRLAAEYPEHRDGLLEFIDNLDHDIENLLLAVPVGPNAKSLEESEEVQSWFNECWEHLQNEFTQYTSPESVAKCVLPSAIIFGFGAIGAALGGPLGFGAGSLTGQLFVGHAKPKAVTDKIEKALEIPKEESFDL